MAPKDFSLIFLSIQRNVVLKIISALLKIEIFSGVATIEPTTLFLYLTNKNIFL